ncbi:MAG TPA: sensor histidine kinase [Thermoanaerobaculia bacterium]|nr:sensor histidine kinase [Thermoanaerobaculia bacterium]
MDLATFAPEYTPQTRAERLIALGRFILAFSSLGAVYLEPSTPARHQQTTYTLLAAYTAYALIVLVLAWRSPVPPPRQRLASHVLDIVLFTLFIYLTEGPASPFFLYFVFSLFCATLRFRWPGIVATGAAATAIYGAMAVIAVILDQTPMEWSRFAVRVAYLGVITALLGYLGVYQEQLRSELGALAAWPREPAADLDRTLRGSLAHAAALLRAPRIAFLWEEPEEPWVYIASWTRGDLTIARAAPGTYDLGELRDASFLSRPGSPVALVLDASGKTTEQTIDPLGERLRRELRGDCTIIGVAVESESVSARMFAFDPDSATTDDLVLARIAGRLLLASLEQLFFIRQVKQTASAEERLCIARDLHDGVIQSLSGVGLQLQSIANDPAAAASRIAHVQRVIESEQRELRELVRELRPAETTGAFDLYDRLRQTAERFFLEWDMTVRVTPPVHGTLPGPPALEVVRIVTESLSNAARHGRASRADVDVGIRGNAVCIRVADNGCGFPFAGRRDLEALEQTRLGPKTLKERVRRLGGTLSVESSESGAVVEASFPIGAGA